MYMSSKCRQEVYACNMRQYLVKVSMTLHGINHFQNYWLHERVRQYRCYLHINFSMIGSFMINILSDQGSMCLFHSIYHHDHYIKTEVTI